MKRYILFYQIVLTFLLFSCVNQPKQEEQVQEETPELTEAVKIPVFNEDSGFYFVKQQVDFGPRVCNTPAHEKAGLYLENKLRQYSKDVYVQKGQVRAWDGTILNFKNLIASFNPDNGARILLCAHWDSRPYADHDPDPAKRNQPVDGANDGASGVGVLLEIARNLMLQSPKVGIDIVFLDAEDYGPPQDKAETAEPGEWWGLGSQYWSKNPHKQGYRARYGILLDMVGATNATFIPETFSMQYAADIVRRVWSTAGAAGYGSYFIYDNGAPINDDHLYINANLNIPTIDIIHLDPSTETGFFPFWHTTSDNLSKIDKNTLKAVGQTLLVLIYTEK